MPILRIATIGLLIFCLTAQAGFAQKKKKKRNRLLQGLGNLAIERDIVYGKAGGDDLLLSLVRPKKSSRKPRAAVVWIHGGGWSKGSKKGGIARLAAVLSGGDYVGIAIDYRRSGKAHWPAQINDCKAAIRWLRANAKKYNIDPDKIGVWGASAGGHLAAMLGTSGDVDALEGDNGSPGQSSSVACVVDFCGPSDFISLAKTKPSVNGSASLVAQLLGETPANNPKLARQASPLSYVSRDDPPFLIVHGSEDQLVPISQGELLHTTLRKAGVPCYMVRIEGGKHAIRGPQVNQRVRAFFDKYLLEKDVKVSEKPIDR